MATNLNPERQVLYGFSKDVAEALAAKWNADDAKVALEWIKQLSGEQYNIPANVQPADVQEALKSGVALCRAMNKIKPGAIAQVNTMKMPFMQRENIEQFVKAAQAYGLRATDVFAGGDLYDGSNIVAVIQCIFSLGGLAKSKGFSPAIGVAGAGAEKNTQNFQFEVKATGDTNALTKTATFAANQKSAYELSIANQIVKSSDVGATGTASKQTSGSVVQQAEKRMDNINRLGNFEKK
eukprot:UN00358